jgi:tetratricopeptide (TPR) repeat protein
LVLFFLFLLIFGVVYSPAIFFKYAFHDDTTFWVRLKDYGFNHIFFNQCLSQCRYGDALLLNLENVFVHKIADLNVLRFLSILILSAGACLVFKHMRRSSVRDIHAFLIIAAMFCLPGFAAIIFYGISSSFFALCILLTCWSFVRIDTGKGVLFPFFAFLFCITLYPPVAMFYWTLTGMRLLFAPDRYSVEFRNVIFRSLGLGLSVVLIYALSVFLMHYFYLHKIGSTLYNPYSMTADIMGKGQWFFREPLKNALNLWDIFPKTATCVLLSAFITISALAALGHTILKADGPKRKTVAFTCLWQLGLFVLVFFLTFLPNLAATGNAAFYRCLAPLSSLVWLILVWTILQWAQILPRLITGRVLTILFFFIAACAGIKTYGHILYDRVLPSAVEWRAYKTMAEEIRSRKIEAIHIFLPYHTSGERYDEFLVLTSHYLFDVYHMIYCAFNEAGVPLQMLPSVYVTFPGDERTFKLEEIYFKKQSDGQWVYKTVNRENRFHVYDHTGRHTLDSGLTDLLTPQKLPEDTKNWYILNISDIFSPSNYNVLVSPMNPIISDNITLEIDPQFAQNYNDRGNADFRQGRFNQAISDFKKAVELKSDYGDAYYNLALAYYRQGNLNQAIFNYNRAIKISPKDAQSYSDRAVIYYQLKKYDKAWEDVHKLQELGADIDPQLISALNATAYQK